MIQSQEMAELMSECLVKIGCGKLQIGASIIDSILKLPVQDSPRRGDLPGRGILCAGKFEADHLRWQTKRCEDAAVHIENDRVLSAARAGGRIRRRLSRSEERRVGKEWG